jgi:hypothetical protein
VRVGRSPRRIDDVVIIVVTTSSGRVGRGARATIDLGLERARGRVRSSGRGQVPGRHGESR